MRGASTICENVTAFGELSPMALAALADGFELLSVSFAFPVKELAEALTSGAFQSDADTCLKELGAGGAPEFVVANDEKQLFASMKKEFSRLYHSPGRLSILYLYESAFLFVERGTEGYPTLFANPITNSVETIMKEAAFLPETAHREPVDSIWQECDLMRHLLTQALARRLSKEEKGDTEVLYWLSRAELFGREHVATWMADFMRATIECAQIPAYRYFAQIGQRIIYYLENVLRNTELPPARI